MPKLSEYPSAQRRVCAARFAPDSPLERDGFEPSVPREGPTRRDGFIRLSSRGSEAHHRRSAISNARSGRLESTSLQRGVSCEPDFLKCVHPHVFVVGDRGFESSIALGGPVSTSLLELNGFLGLAGWKWLYFLEAVPPSCRSVMIGWSTRYCWPTRKSSSTICIATWGTALAWAAARAGQGRQGNGAGARGSKRFDEELTKLAEDELSPQ